MKTTKPSRIQIILIACGLSIISASQLLTRYFTLSDAMHGIMIGAGIGLELSALIFKKKTGHLHS